MKYCIVNADDLGMSSGVNRGIFEAHRRGIVTSASLFTGAPSSEAAAAGSRDAPGLSVGLHVDFTGESANPTAALSAIGDPEAELERQMERFHELMGRAPTHLDSHQNVHRDPRLLPLFRAMARRWGLPLRGCSPVRYFPDFYGQWDGETHLEQISVDTLVRMLKNEFREGVTELSCHPGYVDAGLRSFYCLEREAELRTLCDPAVRKAIHDLGIGLINFEDIDRIPAPQGEPCR